MVEPHTCKSESVLNGEGPLDQNDPILHMEEKIDPQDPVQAVKDSVKKAAENLTPRLKQRPHNSKMQQKMPGLMRNREPKLGRRKWNPMCVKIRRRRS
jgi:hypothetical protein